MKQQLILWIGAAIITFLAGYINSVTDQKFPVTGTIGINGEKVSYKFDKIHKENHDYPVLIRSDAENVEGKTYWHKKNEPWNTVEMKKEGNNLKAEIPLQKPLSKIEYYVLLSSNGKNYRLPGPIELTFYGKVHPIISILYVFFLYGGLLLAVRTGFETFSLNIKIKTYTIFTVIFFFVYTIAVNPLKRSFEIGAINNFIPEISELFGLQSLLLLSCWVIGSIFIFSFKKNKYFALVSAFITIIIFILF